MIIEFEINGAKVVVTGDNLTVNIAQNDEHQEYSSLKRGRRGEGGPIGSVAFIIESLGGSTALSRRMSDGEDAVPVPTINSWKIRNNIPREYWTRLIEVGRDLGFELTREILALAPEVSA